MRLQKNVDIKDVRSILEKGVLCLDDCGNNNWDDGRRAANPTNVVYWAKPFNAGKYGMMNLKALAEFGYGDSAREVIYSDKSFYYAI